VSWFASRALSCNAKATAANVLPLASQDQKLFAVETDATLRGVRWVPKTRECGTQGER
jgi:hypothetical protein